VADAVVTNFFWRFGMLLELHRDQDRNFKSRVLQEVLQRLGVRKTRTMPLHTKLESMVERYIRKVEEYLRKVVVSNERGWDEELPLFLTSL
jgi:hypothetical protein